MIETVYQFMKRRKSENYMEMVKLQFMKKNYHLSKKSRCFDEMCYIINNYNNAVIGKGY